MIPCLYCYRDLEKQEIDINTDIIKCKCGIKYSGGLLKSRNKLRWFLMCLFRTYSVFKLIDGQKTLLVYVSRFEIFGKHVRICVYKWFYNLLRKIKGGRKQWQRIWQQKK